MYTLRASSIVTHEGVWSEHRRGPDARVRGPGEERAGGGCAGGTDTYTYACTIHNSHAPISTHQHIQHVHTHAHTRSCVVTHAGVWNQHRRGQDARVRPSGEERSGERARGWQQGRTHSRIIHSPRTHAHTHIHATDTSKRHLHTHEHTTRCLLYTSDAADEL